MDTQMLQAISYIRNVSKEKVTIDKVVTYLNNVGASNWNKESCEANLKKKCQLRALFMKVIRA